jgi:hypothetical protein
MLNGEFAITVEEAVLDYFKALSTFACKDQGKTCIFSARTASLQAKFKPGTRRTMKEEC